MASDISGDRNEQPEPDEIIVKLAEYVHQAEVTDEETLEAAHLAMLDAFACAILAQKEIKCKQLLGPIAPGTIVPTGSRVPGTNYELDPVKSAFDFSTCIRWLDFNDTWLGLEWGHPSDNLGAIVAVAEHVSRRRLLLNEPSLFFSEVYEALIKAYEIQGMLALENAFNRVGLDHVILVKVASTAVTSKLLGNTIEQTINALTHAWMDGQSLRTYRHAPNTCQRKSWAAGDAAARAVRLSLMAEKDEPGCPSVLSVPNWGFQDVYLKGNPVSLTQPLGNHVIKNVLFKVEYPAEFHAQTAIESALWLRQEVGDRIDEIETIYIETQEAAMRIINKVGPLRSEADRDHCLQYMVAIALIHGELKVEHYSEAYAADPRVDALREKMIITENEHFSKDYLDPQKRSIANGLKIKFKDGTETDPVIVHYPLGHPSRRSEAKPKLYEKYEKTISEAFSGDARDALLELWRMPVGIVEMLEVTKFMELWVLHDN